MLRVKWKDVRNLIIPERPSCTFCYLLDLQSRKLLESIGFGLQSEDLISNASRVCGKPVPKPTQISTPCLHIWLSSALPKSVSQVSCAVHRFCLRPGNPTLSFLFLPHPRKPKVVLGSGSEKGFKDSIHLPWKGSRVKISCIFFVRHKINLTLVLSLF